MPQDLPVAKSPVRSVFNRSETIANKLGWQFLTPALLAGAASIAYTKTDEQLSRYEANKATGVYTLSARDATLLYGAHAGSRGILIIAGSFAFASLHSRFPKRTIEKD